MRLFPTLEIASSMVQPLVEKIPEAVEGATLARMGATASGKFS